MTAMSVCNRCQCSCVFLQDNTSLHYVAYYGHYNMVSSLLNWGSEVDAVNVSHSSFGVCMASCDKMFIQLLYYWTLKYCMDSHQ